MHDELKKSFLGKANEKQLLGNHAIAPVLNEWGEALMLDISNAKYWFREGNSKIPEEIEMQYAVTTLPTRLIFYIATCESRYFSKFLSCGCSTRINKLQKIRKCIMTKMDIPSMSMATLC